MKGLTNRDFTKLVKRNKSKLTSEQLRIAEKLAKIEQEDYERCKGCGGEDCMCCEYYHDRQRWKSPQELFGLEEF